MKVAFWGNFGTCNFGNECTLHAMLAGARRHLPGAELIGVTNNPADTERRHGISALAISPDPTLGSKDFSRAPPPMRRAVQELRDWLRVLREMRGIDMLVMTGTGLLTDTHEGTFGMPYQMFKWVVASWLWRRKVAFVSVGAEGLNDRMQQFFLHWSLRLAQFRSYRDPLSKQRAERLYSAASGDPIYPDLAFSLPKSLTAPAAQGPRDGRTVAVGVYAVESDPDTIRSYVEEIGMFVLWLLERGYRPCLVIGDAEYDEAVRLELKAWLEKKAPNEVVDDRPNAFEELMAQLAQADLVVATRFHNVLLSLVQEKPVVSVSHMDKNEQLMAAMGLESYSLPLGNVQHQDVVARFAMLEQNADQVRAVIRQKLAQFRERLEEQYVLLFADMKR